MILCLLAAILQSVSAALGVRYYLHTMAQADIQTVLPGSKTCRLSVVVIAKNEAFNLARCLKAVAFADQIIVVEQGSQDETIHIAQTCGAHVFSTPDWPGFGVQKNRGLALATGQWVLSLDADELVTPALQSEIEAVVSNCNGDETAPAFEAYEIARLTQFRGQWIYHCGWTPDRVLRLFQRGTAQFSNDLVHEKLMPYDLARKSGRLITPLLHYSYAHTDQYWNKLQRYSQDWAAQRHAMGQTTTMWRAALSAVVAFVRSYFFRLGFLDGAMGFAVCCMQAQAAFGKYFELYCLSRHNES